MRRRRCETVLQGSAQRKCLQAIPRGSLPDNLRSSNTLRVPGAYPTQYDQSGPPEEEGIPPGAAPGAVGALPPSAASCACVPFCAQCNPGGSDEPSCQRSTRCSPRTRCCAEGGSVRGVLAAAQGTAAQPLPCLRGAHTRAEPPHPPGDSPTAAFTAPIYGEWRRRRPRAAPRAARRAAIASLLLRSTRGGPVGGDPGRRAYGCGVDPTHGVVGGKLREATLDWPLGATWGTWAASILSFQQGSR